MLIADTIIQQTTKTRYFTWKESIQLSKIHKRQYEWRAKDARKGPNVTIHFNPLFIAEGLGAINDDIVAIGAIDSINLL